LQLLITTETRHTRERFGLNKRLKLAWLASSLVELATTVRIFVCTHLSHMVGFRILFYKTNCGCCPFSTRTTKLTEHMINFPSASMTARCSLDTESMMAGTFTSPATRCDNHGGPSQLRISRCLPRPDKRCCLLLVYVCAAEPVAARNSRRTWRWPRRRV
jgi:hypothetical protein